MPVQAPDTAVRGLPDFTGLVETVGPAVVNIRTNIKPKAAGPDTSLQAQMQQLIEEYIRRHGGRGGRNAPARRRQRRSPTTTTSPSRATSARASCCRPTATC